MPFALEYARKSLSYIWYFFEKLIIFYMQVQNEVPKEDKPVDYDTVAYALLTAFSKGDNQDEKDNSLAIFLTKLFKNNSIAKSKRMNSIRLSRFNAFLFRVNSPFPEDPSATQVVHASLLAMLGNQRNFQEEQDDQIIMSIAEWACQVMQNTVKRGFFEQATNSLKYLLGDSRLGQPVLPTVADFQELIKDCPYFSNIQLTAQDETKAYHQPTDFHLTSTFSLKQFILGKINLNSFYRQLFRTATNRSEVLTLFNYHIKAVSFMQSKAELFIQTFLNDVALITSQLPLILKTLEDQCLGIDGIRSALAKVLDLGVGLDQIMKLQLKGTRTQQLFLQMLKQRFSNRICQIADAFIATPASNMIAPYLFSNADQNLPLNYVDLLFQNQISQRHLLVAAFALTSNCTDKLFSHLLQIWQQKYGEMDITKNSFVVRALYISLSHIDKNAVLSKICSNLNLSTINGSPIIQSIPLASLRPDKINVEHKNKLTKLLSESKVNENCVPMKIQLLGLCGQNMEMTKRIKYLQNLFQNPVEQILKDVTKESVNKDTMLFTALLMGLNNRMEVTFIQQPNERALNHLATLFYDLDYAYGKRLGQLIGEKDSSSTSHYLWCLFRYNTHTKSSLGNFSQQLNSLLSGSVKYNRVIQTDFSAYFYKEETTNDLENKLWVEKKLLLEMRKIMRKLMRKQRQNLTDRLKDIQPLLSGDSQHVLAVKLVHAYFNANVQDPQVLKHVLSKLGATFGFFQKVFNIFSNQVQEYIQFLEYLPSLLKHAYPQALNFMAKLVDSQPVKPKQKDKKKAKKKKSSILNYDDINPILDLPALFEQFRRSHSYPTLFGDPSQLQSFDELFRIFTKLPKGHTNFHSLLQNWLQQVCIFHPQQGQESKWRVRVLSYCHIWKTIFFELGYKLKLDILSKHFDILTQLLNIHYQSKNQSPELEEQLLLTLLLIMQGGQTDMRPERDHQPLEQLKNCLLGYKLPTITDQHYFICNTCSLSVCQVCAPFLHKHHDLSYTGKDGTCIHDSNPKKLPPPQPNREGASNIFAAQSRPRRQQDLFALNFDLGAEQQMDYNQHIRFRELMEFRLQEQRQKERELQRMDRRERERDRSRSKQADIFLKIKQDIIEETKQDKIDIKSESSKSICNLQKGFKSSFMFSPQFAPIDSQPQLYISPIDAKPLKHILMRQLQTSSGPQNQQGRSKVDLFRERYNFFKQSSYFKNARNDYGGLMRGLNPNSMTKRNLLTSNKKFLAFPSNSNGILLLSVSVMTMKLQRRQNNKATSQYQQQRTFISNAINNSNLAFDPFQLVFGKNNLLAVIGMTQLGFFVLNNEGKVQRFMQSDIKCAQMISKFQWIGRQKSNVFALSYGNTIKLGNVSQDLRIRTGNRLKIQVDNTIKDFQIQLENHNITAFVLDLQGNLYKAQFDFRQARSINIADKKIIIDGVSHLQSMLFFNKRAVVSSSTGKLHLLKNQHKNGHLSLLQTYDLESILRLNVDCKVKGQVFMVNPRVIHANENVSSIACILGRNNSQNKKKGGALAILRFSGLTNDLDIVMISDEQNIEHFQVFELGQNSFALVAVQQTGNVWMAPYSVSSQLLQQRQDCKLPITQQSMLAVNNVIKLQKLLYLVKSCEPKRYDTYKDTKDNTGAYTIGVDTPNKIIVKGNNPHKYFITGITIMLQAAGAGDISLFIFGEERKYHFQKNREIQIGFSLKQSLQCFIQDDQFVIPYNTESCTIPSRAVRIYGVDFSQQTVFRSVYTQLHRIVTIYYLYDQKNIVHYLQNPQKITLPTNNLTDLQKLKSNHKYTHKELVLLMKIQLLRVSANKGMKPEQIQEMLECAKNDLLPQCQRRQFLQKSCWKYIKQLCHLLVPKGISVGHPFEFRTIIDFYNFERCYNIWNSARTLGSFQKLINFLYSLIFKRISNLYLIMHMSTSLIYQLTVFYKNCLHSLKQSGEAHQQQQLSQLINLCPSFVALVCQYYQTLKNSSTGSNNNNKMVDEKDEGQCQRSVLDLLEEVFCATKKQLYREIFVSPEIYLDRLYLTKKEPVSIKSSVRIFDIPQQSSNLNDHASRKQSACQLDPQHDESQLEIQEQSLEEMQEEQAREMPESIIINSSPPQPQELSSPVSLANLKKITPLLNSNILPQGQQINFIYHQFCFQMLSALFKYDNLINKQNGVFYLGFAFNLVRIIQFNVDEERDKEYLDELFKNILIAVEKPGQSILFLVLNYFFQPIFTPKQDKEPREMSGSRSKFAQYLFNYLNQQKIDVEELMFNLKITKTSDPVTMTKAMKFFNFQIQNQVYQLRFIGNLFVLLKSNNHRQFASPSKKMKDFVLGTVVRHKLRIFSNIMVWMKWTDNLEEAKIEVGFQTLQKDMNQGIKLLYNCATQSRQVFVSKLAQNNDFISQLENLLGQKSKKENSILEMLNIYYESE